MEWEKEGVYFFIEGGELGYCIDEDTGVRDGTGLVFFYFIVGDVCGFAVEVCKVFTWVVFGRGKVFWEGN